MDISEYQSTEKWGIFGLLFCFTKILKALTIFFSYDVLKLLPIPTFLLICSLISSVLFILIQKPFTTGNKLRLNHYFKILQYSIFSCLVQSIIFCGLNLCGPLRFILIFEHNEVIVLSILSCICLMNSNNTSKSRGTFIYICAIFSILFLDHDHDEIHHKTSDKIGNGGSLNNDFIFQMIVNKTVSVFGLSDHKLGVFLLIIGILLESCLKQVFSKKISHSIGGFKRLNALTYVFSTVIWSVFSLVLYHFDYFESKVTLSNGFYQSYWHIFIVLLFICVVYSILDFYIASMTANKCGNQFVACYGNVVMGLAGLGLSMLWNHPLITNNTVIHKVVIKENDMTDHNLSAGVLFSQFLIIYSCFLLSSSSNKSKNKGNFVGYSKSGLPLYTFSTSQDDFLHRTGHSIVVHLKKTLLEILRDDSSRRIFYYLCINLAFAFVELFYGFLTNSLALISDGFHMLFDSTAIVMGLYAAVVSQWKPTKTFSYGYHRAEALSGFINGLFLVVISISVCCNGIGRLIHPPQVSTERLLVVSVLGLLVNLFGIVALGHSHSHGGGSSHSHSHGHSHVSHTAGHKHGHSHGGDSHGHSHDSEHDSSNMRGVYLHVLADTLGSVGVIFSSFLMEQYGLYIADPICSLFISVLIFRSVVPLLSQTISILTLQPPSNDDDDSDSCISKYHQSVIIKELLTIEEIIEIRDPLIWQHTGKINCCNIRIFLHKFANEQELLDKVTRCMRYFKFDHVTIQLEKETFEMHMIGLGNKTQYNAMFDKSSHTPNIVVVNTNT